MYGLNSTYKESSRTIPTFAASANVLFAPLTLHIPGSNTQSIPRNLSLKQTCRHNSLLTVDNPMKGHASLKIK